MITAAGTLFALLTGSLRQWQLEKWPGRRLNEPKQETAHVTDQKPSSAAESNTPISANEDLERGASGPSPSTVEDQLTVTKSNSKADQKCRCIRKPNKVKTVCLTRGNGHQCVMVMICSGTAWDLETLSTATSSSLPETHWCLGVLAVAWMCLLICVSGLESDTWYLVLVGGLGMVQNLYASTAARTPQSMGLKLEPYAPVRTIIGSSSCESKFWPHEEEEDVMEEDELTTADNPLINDRLGPIETVGTRGAIRELEKTIPGAGFALMPIFFPALSRVDEERYRDAKEVRFWRLMLKRRENQKRDKQ